MGNLETLEGVQLTFGNLIGLIVLISAVCVAVWGIFKIRNNDKDEIKTESSNALNRIDRKLEDETDVLHARVNRLMEENTKTQYDMGFVKGFIKGKFDVDSD